MKRPKGKRRDGDRHGQRWASAAFATVIACSNGDSVVQTGDGTGGPGSGDTSTSTSSSSTSTTSSTESSSDSADSSSDGSTGTLPDLPPYPTACDAPEALIDVAASTTPQGAMVVHEAWISTDACGQGPFVVLSQTPTIDVPQAIEVSVAIDSTGLRSDPLLGEVPAYIWGDADATGTITLLDPFHVPDLAGMPRPDEHLHAQVEIHSGGYDLSLEVDLIDCGVWGCSCPCR